MAVAIVTAILGAGCSFGMTTLRKDRDVSAPPLCSDSIVPPVVDGVVGAGAATGALLVYDYGRGDGFEKQARVMGATFLALGAIVYGISTGYGIVHYRRCRNAKASFQSRTSGFHNRPPQARAAEPTPEETAWIKRGVAAL